MRSCIMNWLCRQQVPRLPAGKPLGGLGPWSPAARWWHGAQPEWDLVSDSLDGRRVLLGEVKWSSRPFDRRTLEPILRELAVRPAPPLPPRLAGAELIRALFVPAVASKPGAAAEVPESLMLVTAADLLEDAHEPGKKPQG